MCYYGPKAVYVKDLSSEIIEPTPDEMYLLIQSINWARGKSVKLSDLELNYTRFNIGYCNRPEATTWIYRKPLKQYAQGLRSNQMGYVTSNPGFGGLCRFEYSKYISWMMENVYPDLETCEQRLKDGESYSVAFHRDFGVSYDKMHRDLIIEYKGRQVGTSKNFKDFDLLAENRHLTEALREALHVG